MSPSETHLLVVLRRPPGGDALSFEALDLAMACGAFIPHTTLVFRDAGVLQLAAGQAPDLDTGRSLEKTLHALREYGLEHNLVHLPSLAQFGVSAGDLTIPCRGIDEDQYRLLVRSHDHVIGL